MLRIVLSLAVLVIAAGIAWVVGIDSAFERNSSTEITASMVDTRMAAEKKSGLPDLVLKDLSGKDVRLSEYQGKVLLLNFWATWCGPCRAEIPDFIKLREQYRADRLEVIGISLDEGDPKAVLAFASQLQISYPILVGNRKVVSTYGPIAAVPTTIVIDRRGQIRSRHLGMLTYDEIKNEIKPLL